MTTIAFRDGIMAADSRAYSGGSTPMGEKAKLFRFGEVASDLAGAIMGVSSLVVGNGATLYAEMRKQGAVDWGPLPFAIKCEALLALPDGSVYHFNDGTSFSGPLTAPFFAIGSGADFALGAMLMGANARKAVEVACTLDVWSAPPITVMELSKPDPAPRTRTVQVARATVRGFAGF